jgi:hypothetical protein
MKLLLFITTLLLGGSNATGTMPDDHGDDYPIVILQAPPSGPIVDAPLVDLWELPRQICALLAEAPAGMIWFLVVLLVGHWTAITMLVRAKARCRAYHEGRADVLEALHLDRTCTTATAAALKPLAS